MKKILISSVAVAAGIILLYAFKPGRQAGTYFSPGAVAAPATKMLTDIDTIQNKTGQGLISGNLAQDMSAAYKNDAAKSMLTDSAGKKENDALSIWFDLETLKSFIAKIDKSIPKTKTRPLLGVRVYYAKYPSAGGMLQRAGLEGLSTEVQYRHTLFMVPTYYDKQKNMNVDYSYESVGNPARPTPYYKLLIPNPARITIPSILGVSNDQFLFKARAAHLRSADAIQNHGGLMPPPAGEGTFPTPANDEQNNN